MPALKRNDPEESIEPRIKPYSHCGEVFGLNEILIVIREVVLDDKTERAERREAKRAEIKRKPLTEDPSLLKKSDRRKSYINTPAENDKEHRRRRKGDNTEQNITISGDATKEDQKKRRKA